MKPKIGAVLRELHRGEGQLAEELLRLSERHPGDHDIHHLARDLAGWSRRHATRIAELADARDAALDRQETTLAPPGAEPGLDASGAAGPDPDSGDPGLALLVALRRIRSTAAGVSGDWEMLAQAAQALRDTELMGLARECHPDTLRQAQWANAKLKELSPQILVS